VCIAIHSYDRNNRNKLLDLRLRKKDIRAEINPTPTPANRIRNGYISSWMNKDREKIQQSEKLYKSEKYAYSPKKKNPSLNQKRHATNII